MIEQFDLFSPPQSSLPFLSPSEGLKPLIFDFGLDVVYRPPQPPPQPTNPYKITFPDGISLEDEVIAAWKSMPDYQHKKIRLSFRRPVHFWANTRSRIEREVYDCRLFIGKESQSLCYRTSKKTGFQFEGQLHYLISIEPVPEEEVVERFRKLANRIHPNAWDDLKAKLLTNPEEYSKYYGYAVTSITEKFRDDVLESIHRAFEEKSDYSYETGGYRGRGKKASRRLKVECKMCDDGIFRAWFSSGYPERASDHWLLVGPTTAILKERD